MNRKERTGFIMDVLSRVAALSVLAFASGCGSPAAPDNASFVNAVKQIIRQRDTIRDGFASGDIDAAHGPLHEVGHTLLSLVELAGKEDLSDSDQQSIKTSVDTLMDAFGAVDATLHGGEGSTYAEESATIDAALKVIADIAGVPLAEPTVTHTVNDTVTDTIGDSPTETVPETTVDAPPPLEETPAPAPPNPAGE
ncbi:MAG: hypothetical protein R3C59_02110 [Planctomycetaceae bacterium]